MRTTMDVYVYVYGHVLPVTDDAVTAAREQTFKAQPIRLSAAT